MLRQTKARSVVLGFFLVIFIDLVALHSSQISLLVSSLDSSGESRQKLLLALAAQACLCSSLLTQCLISLEVPSHGPLNVFGQIYERR